MEYIAGRTDFKLKNSAVTLGKFDGLHLGHQLLLNKIAEQKKSGLNAVVFTFLYHPVNLLSDREMELIYTEEEKQCIIDKYGMDVMISYPFTEETRAMEPEHFIEEVLINKLDAKYIVVGSDFCFGKNRRGNTEMLAEYASKYNYKLEIITKKKSADEDISSSCIRKQISEGNMENVVKLLGRPFSVMGEVMHGRKIGRTIGFPTTNLMPEKSKLLPPDGVYVSITIIEGREFPGLTNIGHNPTVGTTPEKRVETFLFDYDQDLYGKFIEVTLLSRTRKEETFGSLEELKVQMDIDLAEGRKYFMDLGLLQE